VAELLIATHNQGKFQEIGNFFKQERPNLQVKSLSALGKKVPEIVEDGSSFLENARKKANIISSFSGLPTLADDSGLEVEALGGRPGIFSARFAGPNASDEQNVQKLLGKLEGLPDVQRNARFVCAMVLSAPSGITHTAVSEISGRIAHEPRGTTGFGYDPIFLIPPFDRTLAEMSLSEKNQISHRARALQKIKLLLDDFLAKA